MEVPGTEPPSASITTKTPGAALSLELPIPSLPEAGLKWLAVIGCLQVIWDLGSKALEHG